MPSGPGIGELTQVTFGFGNHEHPVFSPDGKWIAYYGGTYGYIQLYVVDPQGRNRRPLTCARGNHTQAAWSPDGKWIYHRHQPTTTAPWEIWRVAFDDPSQRERILFDPKGKVSFKHPSPSPDGKWLAWFSDEGSPGNFHLFKGRLGQARRIQLTDDPDRNDCHPTWSPNGEWLAFHAYLGKEDASVSHIYVCDADGKAIRRLTDTEEFHKHPFFVGSELVVHHTDQVDGRRHLALRRFRDGALVGKLTSGKRNDKHPSPFVPERGPTKIVFASKKRGLEMEQEGEHSYDIFWGALEGTSVRR
jgi:TolB protein